MKQFRVIDIRNDKSFPNLAYRFSDIAEDSYGVRLYRDFLGENPLHYYIDMMNSELIVGSNIADIKDYLERKRRHFLWERVRAVSNNTEVYVDDAVFLFASPREKETGPTLQEYSLPYSIDYANLQSSGRKVRDLLEESVETRLSTVHDDRVGLLLSGGLDSMSIGYILSRKGSENISAFTLKVDENEKDVTRSREVAQRFGLPLSEVKITPRGNILSISMQQYDTARKLISERHVEDIDVDEAVSNSLRISGNPKKDNAFCSIAMYLIGKALQEDGIETVFCGEGPNEMLNDYGYVPSRNGYSSDDIGNVKFREALTFGLKKTDRQLGRGGLPKHALARMGKMFANYDIRLESPYFQQDIARIMTKIPHSTSHDTIKQHLMAEMFAGEGIDDLIFGVSKEKFQDGSGISRILHPYTQDRLIEYFDNIYGIRKIGYL